MTCRCSLLNVRLISLKSNDLFAKIKAEKHSICYVSCNAPMQIKYVPLCLSHRWPWKKSHGKLRCLLFRFHFNVLNYGFCGDGKSFQGQFLWPVLLLPNEHPMEGRYKTLCTKSVYLLPITKSATGFQFPNWYPDIHVFRKKCIIHASKTILRSQHEMIVNYRMIYL